MPCLVAECTAPRTTVAVEADLCAICYTSSLVEEPCVALGCSHVFHAGCILRLLEHRWTSLRITFGFLACPSCKEPLSLKTKCNSI